MDFININSVLSYHAPFNIISAVRGTGKTTGAKIRTYKRYKRKNEGTCWVRRIEIDTQRTRQTFFNRKFFELTGADPETVRIKGNYAEMKIGRSWERFVEFTHLSRSRAERSSDDSLFTLLLLDEGIATRDARNRYKGSEVTDFLDLYDSKRRNSGMQSLILGNRETTANPYLFYFGIETPPYNWNGVRSYRDGSIVYMQRTTPPESVSDLDEKVKTALAGTAYGAYKYDGHAKGVADAVHIGRQDTNRMKLYACFNFEAPVSAWYNEKTGSIYFAPGINLDMTIITLQPSSYRRSMVYAPRYKHVFSLLATAKRNNNIWYADEATAEVAQNVIDVLCI